MNAPRPGKRVQNSIYRAERHNGTWSVIDTRSGDVVDELGTGAAGAERARQTAVARDLAASRASAAASLRDWRKARHLSQQKLADLLGVTWLTVQRWEAGSHTIPGYLQLALRELERELESEGVSNGRVR